MAEGAILATALNPATATAWGLYQGGLNVAKEPGGSGFGVDPADVTINEVGPGGVSSMTYAIDDPSKEVSVGEGSDVSFWDLTNNVCLFRGWADSASPEPDFGGQGRRIRVECTGVEAVLDWTIVPAGYSIGSGARAPGYIALLAQTYAPILKAPGALSGMSSAPFTQNGSFDYPIGSMKRATEPSLPTQFAAATTTGGTLRQAISQIIEISSWLDVSSGNFPGESVAALVTVDNYFGLRVWEDNPSLQPDDYTTLTISDTYAGPNRAAGLSARVDWAGVMRNVTVVGSGGTVYGPFGDGSGIFGPGGYISDTTIAAEDVARVRARGLMAQVQSETRGTFMLEDWMPTTTVHAGSLITITDAATGLSATHRIMEIEKTFPNSGRQTWRVTFGGLPAHSVTRLVRRFTRSQLN